LVWSVGLDKNRERWRDFVCSPDHAGRHLSSIGSSVIGAKSDQISVDELEAFLNRLEGGYSDVVFLAMVIELVGGGYLQYLEHVLPDLLDQLSSETERHDEVVGPALKGAPRWGQTIIGRLSGQLRYGRYYSRAAHRSYDLPENRVVRWLVGSIASIAGDIVRRSPGGRVPEQIARIVRASEDLLLHPVLSEINASEAFDDYDGEVAENSSRLEYRQAAALAGSLVRITEADSSAKWHAILMLLAVNWLEPISDDDLFELYVLVLVIDVLVHEVGLGEPSEFGLVRTGRRHVAKFDVLDGSVEIYFDFSVAAILGQRGRYFDVLDEYPSASGSERRPDIVIVHRDSVSKPKTALVEVKRSESDRYISDSIYKVFGYLFDYQDIWNEDARQPRAILAVPGTVTRRSGRASGPVGIVSGDDRETLAEMLSASLELGKSAMPASPLGIFETVGG